MTDDALRQEHREYLCAPWQWRSAVRRSDLPKWVKYILLTAADHANKDGTSIKVGVALLAVESETSYNRTQDALRLARRSGLLFLAYEGNRRRQLPGEWWLILHPDVMEHIRVELPDAQKQRAASMRAGKQESWTKSKKADPAAGSTDESCPPVEGMNEDDEAPIMPSGRGHEPKTSCPPLGGTKCESCPPLGSETAGSCPREWGTTSKSQGDLADKTPTPSDENDVETAAHPPREAMPSVEDQISDVVDIASRRCKHSRSAGFDNGVPRCADCRIEAVPILPAPTPKQLPKIRPPGCPKHPEMKGGNRGDGLPHCTFCRQKVRAG